MIKTGFLLGIGLFLSALTIFALTSIFILVLKKLRGKRVEVRKLQAYIRQMESDGEHYEEIQRILPLIEGKDRLDLVPLPSGLKVRKQIGMGSAEDLEITFKSWVEGPFSKDDYEGDEEDFD